MQVQAPKPQNRSRRDATTTKQSELSLTTPSAKPAFLNLPTPNLNPCSWPPTDTAKQAPHHNQARSFNPSGTLPPVPRSYTVCLAAAKPRPSRAKRRVRERKKESKLMNLVRLGTGLSSGQSHVRWLNPSGGFLLLCQQGGNWIWGALCFSPWLGGTGCFFRLMSSGKGLQLQRGEYYAVCSTGRQDGRREGVSPLDPGVLGCLLRICTVDVWMCLCSDKTGPRVRLAAS